MNTKTLLSIVGLMLVVPTPDIANALDEMPLEHLEAESAPSKEKNKVLEKEIAEAIRECIEVASAAEKEASEAEAAAIRVRELKPAIKPAIEEEKIAIAKYQDEQEALKAAIDVETFIGNEILELREPELAAFFINEEYIRPAIVQEKLVQLMAENKAAHAKVEERKVLEAAAKKILGIKKQARRRAESAVTREVLLAEQHEEIVEEELIEQVRNQVAKIIDLGITAEAINTLKELERRTEDAHRRAAAAKKAAMDLMKQTLM